MPPTLVVSDSSATGASMQTTSRVSIFVLTSRPVHPRSLRGSVLGMEVVLADGSVVDALSPLKKNNTVLEGLRWT